MKTRLRKNKHLLIVTILFITSVLSACANSPKKSGENTEKNSKESVQDKVFESKLENEPDVLSEKGSIEEITSGKNISRESKVVDFNNKGIFVAKGSDDSFEIVNSDSGETVIKPSEGYKIWSFEDVFCFEDGSALWIEAKLFGTGLPDDKTWVLKYKDSDGKVSDIDKSKGHKIKSDTFNITQPISLSANNSHISYSTFEEVDGKIKRVIKLYDIKANKMEIIDSIEDYENKWYSVDLGKEHLAYSISEKFEERREFGKIYLYSIKDGEKEELKTDYNLLHPQISENYLVAALKPEGENFIINETDKYTTKEFWVYDLNKKVWSFRVTNSSAFFDNINAPSIGANLDSFEVDKDYLTIGYLGKTESFIIVDMGRRRIYSPEEILGLKSGESGVNLNMFKFATSDTPALIWSKSDETENNSSAYKASEFEITKLK